MITTCLRSGWRAALGNRKLAFTVWAWNALFALAAGLATWRWLNAAFARAPEADKLTERFRVGLVVELLQYDRFSPMTVLNGAVLGLLLVAAIGNPLVAAGVIEVITSGDERPVLHRFFRGAGHFFGRFFRLLAISGVAAVLLVIVVGALTRPITTALGESSWERTWIAAGLGRMALLGALLGFVAVVLDVARVKVATADTEVRGMLRAWFSAARLTLRHIGPIVVLGVAYVALFCVLLGAYALVSALVPGRTWAGILVLFVLQQAFMVARAGLRIGRAGAAVEFCRARAVVSEPVLQP